MISRSINIVSVIATEKMTVSPQIKNMSQMVISVSRGRFAWWMKMVRNHWNASKLTVNGGLHSSRCFRSLGRLRSSKTWKTLRSMRTPSRFE